MGYALPERLKEFYLQYNGGEPKQQTISINKYHEVEIIIFQPFKYNKSFKNALFHTVEGETLEHRSSNSISDNILLFASGHNNLRNIGVIAINIKNRAVYFYRIIGFVKNSDAFIFDEPQLIADSIDDFFNNLVAFPKIEEEQQTEIIEIEGVMPELSDCSASLAWTASCWTPVHIRLRNWCIRLRSLCCIFPENIEIGRGLPLYICTTATPDPDLKREQ